MKPLLGGWLLAALLFPPVYGQAVTTDGKVRHAQDFPELIASFEFTLDGILSEEEKANLMFRDPERVREVAPELYEEVSQNIRRWTEDWLEYAAEKLERVPEARVERARAVVAKVDALLIDHFDERGWPYRTLRPVFLPQRLLYGQNHGGKLLGVFIPFYPDVFFTTVDPHAPLEYIVVHESLHYNASSGRYGRAFVEGVTDASARRLVIEYGLLSKATLRNMQIYPRERKLVDVVVESVVRRSGQSSEEALETLLEAYVTDDDSRLTELFGEETWEKIVELSWSSNWRKSDILKVFEGQNITTPHEAAEVNTRTP